MRIQNRRFQFFWGHIVFDRIRPGCTASFARQCCDVCELSEYDVVWENLHLYQEAIWSPILVEI